MRIPRGVYRVIISLLAVAVFPVYAGVSFHSPDINSSDETLFCARQNIPGTLSYSTLLYTKIENGTAVAAPKVLTCYPEKMDYLAHSDSLRLRNRYGTALYSFTENNLVWTKTFDELPLDCGKLTPVSVSPDGKWLCYIDRTDITEGKLILESFSTHKKIVLDDHSEFGYGSVHVKWSSGSDMLLYEKDDAVYFCSPAATFGNIEIADKLRRIGRGTINSVCWADKDTLVYIDNDIIYRIDSGELYTIGLYSDFIPTGTAIGRLPSAFDAGSDEFWVNDTESEIVLVQSKCIISYFKTVDPGYSYVDTVYSGPYTGFNGTVLAFDVLWNGDGSPVVWVDTLSLEDGKRNISVYLLGSQLTRVLTAGAAGLPCISPDGTKVAFTTGSTVYVYSVNPWERKASLGGENVVSLAWKDPNILCIGGDKTVRQWNISSGENKVLFLSSAERGFWSDSGDIYADTSQSSDSGEHNLYLYDKKDNIWFPETDAVSERASVQNGKYRIFTADTPNANYDNALYVRTLVGNAVTRPLFSYSVVKSFPRKKAVLVFDAMDSSAGLSRILSILDDYHIKSTFFINGEFIRRYPAETRQIAVSGHECGSLFFTTTDLTAGGFVADENFIRRGLARTEDEFYACTGKELSLIWHAPFYLVTPEIIRAGKAAGYTYVDAPEKYRDFNTLYDTAECGTAYMSAGKLIDEYLNSLKSATPDTVPVIPVTVGLAHGGRVDYLYEKLDVLVEAILDAGYDIVPYQENDF